MQFRNHLFRRFAGTAKLYVRTRTRSALSFRQHQTKQSDLHATKFANSVRRHIAKRLACLQVDYVRSDPAEPRFLDSLSQHVWSEVELVVPKRGVVEPDCIPGVDHLRTLESDRLNRRRDRVAGH